MVAAANAEHSAVAVALCPGARLDDVPHDNFVSGVDPVEFVRAGMHRCGLTPDDFQFDSCVIQAGETLDISTLTPSSRAALRTGDIDLYKQWIGAADRIAAGATAVKFDSARLRDPRDVRLSASQLDAATRADLMLIAENYLFADSSPVRCFKAELEKRFGPFPVHVFTAGRIEIKPGGTLLLEGSMPKALFAREVILHDGGEITLKARARLCFGALSKVENTGRAA